MIHAAQNDSIFLVPGHLVTLFLTSPEFVKLVSTSRKWIRSDPTLVDCFPSKPWIHHDAVRICWSELLWFAQRGAWLQYSPWIDDRQYTRDNTDRTECICGCLVCRANLIARVDRGEIVELQAYGAQRSRILREARECVENAFMTRLAFVRDIRRRNNRHAPGSYSTYVSENARSRKGYSVWWADDEHEFTDKEIGFEALFWYTYPMPPLQWLNGRLVNTRNSQGVLLNFHPDGHPGIGHDEEPL
jgi:hypothetical protein